MRYNLADYSGKPKADRSKSTLAEVITDLDTLAPAERVMFERLIEQGRRRIVDRAQLSAG
ncbi:MAG: hypothetical protein O3B90_13460 [Actinomycetota bacterium]|nr:hypothetical protein [Actinomycetota bacterium]